MIINGDFFIYKSAIVFPMYKELSFDFSLIELSASFEFISIFNEPLDNSILYDLITLHVFYYTEDD